MDTRNKIIACTLFLFAASFTSLRAESITTLYDLDFNAPTHTVGQPPVCGSFVPTCKTIQYYELPPIIIDTFGELTDQSCLFYLDPNQTSMYDRPRVGLDMYDNYDQDARKYPRYKIEMDIFPELIGDSFFWIDFTCGNLEFFSDGRVSDQYTDATYPTGQIIHAVIDVDFETNQYVIAINGSPVFTRIPAFDGIPEIQIIIFRGPNDTFDSKAAIDNVVVYGIDNQPELHVTKPELGDGFSVGKTYPITWYSSSDIQDVTIEYSTDSGSTWTDVSPPNSGNTGLYEWTVPDAPSNLCKLRLTDPANGNQAESDIFRICPPVPDLPPYEVVYLDDVFGEYAQTPLIINDYGDFIGKGYIGSKTAWCEQQFNLF